jgi:hypothetical protein
MPEMSTYQENSIKELYFNITVHVKQNEEKSTIPLFFHILARATEIHVLAIYPLLNSCIKYCIYLTARQGFFLKFGAQICEVISNSLRKCPTGPRQTRLL